MDTVKELRSSVFSGIVTALIVSLPQIFWVGIGGALVSAVMGSVVSSVAGMATSRITQKAREAARAQTQITGVLDSSQLGVDEQAIEEKLPFAGRGKVVTIAVSLVTSLVTGMIVSGVTHGTGINFYLGGMPTTTQSAASSSASTDTESQGQQDWQPEVTTTHYDTETSDTDEVSVPSLPAQEDATDQGASSSSTDDGTNNQPESKPTEETEQTPSEQTPPSGGTIDGDAQQAQP